MSSPDRVAIFGASGFAREVADIALALGATEIVFMDAEPESDSLLGFPVVSESEASALVARGFVLALGIGANNVRQKVYERHADAQFPALIHPTATFGYKQREAVESQPGVIVAAGARFMNSITVSRGCVFSLNVTVGHDVIAEPFVGVMPGATISGNVHLGARAYVGTGANIIQGKSPAARLHIAEDAVVGAGAVVSKPVASGVTVVGVPARPLG